MDRLRAFRRRQESPTPSDNNTRSSSPGWLSKMNSRSYTRRAQSPAVATEGASMSGQMDGCFGSKPSAADAAAQDNVGNKKAAVGEAAPKAPNPKVQDMPKFLRLSDAAYREKFDLLNQLEATRVAQSEGGGQWSRLDPDPVLDRYNNIYPWANNRVSLKVPEDVNNYINASPITLVSTAAKQSALKAGIQDKYICMQGPKKETVDHVWHMIWHELGLPYNSSPGVIIMLSPLYGPLPNDPTKIGEKCYAYYPVNEDSPPIQINDSGKLGNFEATVKFVRKLPPLANTAIEVRELEMIVHSHGDSDEGEDDEEEEEAKTIWHFLYPSWPDFGSLEEDNVAAILALMEISRKENGRGENARIVHCSAGVGRTGTFVALEFLLGELQGGAWEGWDKSDKKHNDPIFETVDQLRMQRKTMIQSYEQYYFLYEVLRKIWEEKYNVSCVGGDHIHPNQGERAKTYVCGIGPD